jgi:hypothetical protein
MGFSGMQNEQSLGFFNRSIVALLIMFIAPAILVVGGFFFVAMQGRIPGGSESSCEQNLSDDLRFRLEIYAYQSGLTLFELQTFSISDDNGSTWRELFEDDVRAPLAIDCENNILQLSDGIFLLFNRKTVAISPDTGLTWQIHHVCDNPRPTDNSCDADILNIVSVDIEESGQAQILIQESIVDVYGEPLTENGEALIKQEYVLSTSDLGYTWMLENTR